MTDSHVIKNSTQVRRIKGKNANVRGRERKVRREKRRWRVKEESDRWRCEGKVKSGG